MNDITQSRQDESPFDSIRRQTPEGETTPYRNEMDQELDRD